MLDFLFMLQVKLPVVDPQSDKFVMGVENKATGDSKLNDSPGLHVSIWTTFPAYRLSQMRKTVDNIKGMRVSLHCSHQLSSACW